MNSRIPKAPSKGEASLALQLNALGIPFQREVRFAPPRLWRFDFVLTGKHAHIACEVEGGLYVNGGHSRGRAYEKNLEKYNTAALMGFSLYRFSTDMVTSGEALKVIQMAMERAA